MEQELTNNYACSTSLLFLACTAHAKSSNGQCVRLYKNSTCNEGIVQVEQNGKWCFINGSDLDYSDACVLCKNLGENVKHFNMYCAIYSCAIVYCILGYKGVERFFSRNTTCMIPTRNRRSNFDISSIIPGITKAIHCIGNEQNAGQCLLEAVGSILPKIFKALPPGSNVTVKDVGWVSCTGTCTLNVSVNTVTVSTIITTFYFLQTIHLPATTLLVSDCIATVATNMVECRE